MTVMGDTGPLSADGSFVASDFAYTWQGVFATEGGTTVIRDGTGEYRARVTRFAPSPSRPPSSE